MAVNTSIAEGSIKLRVKDETERGVEAANKKLEKFKKDQQKRMGDLAQAGEKFAGAFARAGSASGAFERLASGSDTFRASVDAAAQSVGNLVNSIQLAKATGGTIMSGLGFGLAGLAIGAIGGFLGGGAAERDPDGTGFLRRRGVETTPPPRFGFAPGAEERLRALGELGSTAERERDALRRLIEERRARTRLETETPTRDILEMREMGFADPRDPRAHATLARLTGELRTRTASGETGDAIDAFGAAVGEFRRSLHVWDGILVAEARDRHVAEVAERDRVRRLAVADADMGLGSSLREGLRTPREVAVAELRRLMEADARTPGAIGEDLIRRRAEVLARGLEGARPIGVAGLDAGSVEATRAITAAMTSRESEADAAERLLAEVRDSVRTEGERTRDLLRVALTPLDTISRMLGGAGLTP